MSQPSKPSSSKPRRAPLLLLLVIGATFAFAAIAGGCKSKKESKQAKATREKRSRRAPAFKKDDWGLRACVYKPCYKRFKVFGQISGRVEIRVDKTGAATQAVYRRGKAPAPVRKCIIAAARKVKIPGFFGNPGTAYCEYSGQLMAGGIEMMSDSWGFREQRKLILPAPSTMTPRPAWYPEDFPLPTGGRLVKTVPPAKKSAFYTGLFLFGRPLTEIDAAIQKGAKAQGWKLKSTTKRGPRGTRREWIHQKPKRRRILTQTRSRQGGTLMLIVPPPVK